MLKVYLCILLERSQFSGECNCAFVILCNIGLGHPALEKKRRKKKKASFLVLPSPATLICCFFSGAILKPGLPTKQGRTMTLTQSTLALQNTLPWLGS